MNRKLVLVMKLTLVLVGMLGVAFDVQKVEAIGTITINADGSIDPPSAPINTTDMITYYFNGNIASDFHGIFIERDNIVVDGAGYTIEGTKTFGSIGIDLTDRINVTIKNMEIAAFYCGIRLDESSNNTISGNTITNNGDGIYFHEPSHNNTISENDITNNGNYGIALLSSLDNTMSGNKITNNGHGIYSNSSHNNIISGNNITNNSNCGIWFRYSSNNIFYGNTVTNITQWGILGAWGVLLEISGYNNISRNTIADNRGFGIHLVSCWNSSITGNNITNNGNGLYGDGDGYGICLASCSNNTLTGNTVTDNDYGIYFDYGSSNTLTGNSITNNDNGIRIEGYSYWNLIHHNNFIDNTQQVYIPVPVPASFWDDGYPSGGNYWDDYEEIDTDGDGIGNTPYDIYASNQDRYPLIAPPIPIPIVLDEMIFPVELKGNSTISRFRFDESQRMISFNVTGPDGTLGFCNLTIPRSLIQDLWQSNYTVLVDGKEPLTMNNWTDGTYTYIYFTYLHSTHKIEIIPEFPTWISMLLLLTVLTAATVIYKRKQSKK